MAYVTIEQFKLWFSIAGDTEDEQIQQAINTAVTWFEGITGRTYEAGADTTRYFDADRDTDRDTLYFYQLDLCQLTSVVNGDGQTIPNGDLITEPRQFGPYYALRLKLSSSHAWTYTDTPEDAIAVTGRWAYSITPPDDVKQAVLDVAKSHYEQRLGNVDATQATASPSGFMLAPAGLPKSVWGAVKRYKRGF